MSVCNYTYLLIFPLVPEIHADLLWDLSLVFGGLALLYFLFIFFLRNRQRHKNKEVRLRKKELGPMISNFLFYEDDVSLQEKYNYVQLKLEIRELLKDDFNRKVLVNILLDLQKDIAGDARNRLFKLYKDLGLHLDAFEKLKSLKWEVISQGILELTQLQVEESYGFIKKFINHRRGVIRKQAQIATVSLKHEGIVYFLDTCKYRISEWQQLKLLDVIRNLEDFQPPRFKAWLTAKNIDVVLFSLRLIKYYKQNDANTSLIELVKHTNDQIKVEAINCIKEFVVFEALDTLKAVFWNCSPHVKLTLLDAVASLGKDEEVPFLQIVESKESNFMVKSKALSSINVISPGTIMPTIGIESVPAYNHKQEALEIDSLAKEEIKEAKVADVSASQLEDPENELFQNIEEISFENSSDISADETLLNKEAEATRELQESEIDEITLNWEAVDKAPSANNDVNEEKEELAVEVPQGPELTTEFSEAKNSNDPDETSMEQKEKNQWTPEETFKEITEEPIPDFEETKISSEEAYWETVLDPENEDEIIFDICLMEELEDILAEGVKPEEFYAPHEILPLNFLPIVEGQEGESGYNHDAEGDPILNIWVEEEVVHEDEKFAEELDRILQKIRTSGENEEEEEIVLNFLPLVTASKENTEIEVEVEELAAPLDEFDFDCEDVQDPKDPKDATEEQELSVTLPWETLERSAPSEDLIDIEVSAEVLASSTVDTVDKELKEEVLFELNRDLDERVSIFNELFRTCDAESKLILIDEILAVGDERDLKFLDTLVADEDERVRKKAKKIGEKLKDYLASTAEKEQESNLEDQSDNSTSIDDKDSIESAEEELTKTLKPLEYCFFDENKSVATQPMELFEIGFELNNANGQHLPSRASANPELVGESAQTSLLNDILSIPSKLIQKFNG